MKFKIITNFNFKLFLYVSKKTILYVVKRLCMAVITDQIASHKNETLTFFAVGMDCCNDGVYKCSEGRAGLPLSYLPSFQNTKFNFSNIDSITNNNSDTNSNLNNKLNYDKLYEKLKVVSNNICKSNKLACNEKPIFLQMSNSLEDAASAIWWSVVRLQSKFMLMSFILNILCGLSYFIPSRRKKKARRDPIRSTSDYTRV